MDRVISANEVEVVEWLLDHALVDVTGYRLKPTAQLIYGSRTSMRNQFCHFGPFRALTHET